MATAIDDSYMRNRVDAGRDQHVYDAVNALNFKGIRQRLHTYGWLPTQIDLAVRDYRRFLIICGLYPGVEFVPTADIDKVWHEHSCDSAYAAACQTIFGRLLHYRVSSDRESGYPILSNAFRKEFRGEYPGYDPDFDPTAGWGGRDYD